MVMSVVTFITMWRDKRAAVAGSNRRTPESTLHLIELLGGWPGTLAAQRLVRHKTRKTRYLISLWLIIALHIGVWCGVAALVFFIM